MELIFLCKQLGNDATPEGVMDALSFMRPREHFPFSAFEAWKFKFLRTFGTRMAVLYSYGENGPNDKTWNHSETIQILSVT